MKIRIPMVTIAVTVAFSLMCLNPREAYCSTPTANCSVGLRCTGPGTVDAQGTHTYTTCVGNTALYHMQVVIPDVTHDLIECGGRSIDRSFSWTGWSSDIFITPTDNIYDFPGAITGQNVWVSITRYTPDHEQFSVTVTAIYIDCNGNALCTTNPTQSKTFDLTWVGVSALTVLDPEVAPPAAVGSGLYLLKDQGKSLEMSVTIAPSTASWPSGSPVWNTTAGGTFVDSSGNPLPAPVTGSSVIWKQSNSFVSSKPDDVVITVKCGQYDPGATMAMTVVKLTLQAVAFSGNHTLYTDNGTYGSNGTGTVTAPEIAAGTPPKPICYTKSTTPTMIATLAIVPTLTAPNRTVILRAAATQNGRSRTLSYLNDAPLVGTTATVSLGPADITGPPETLANCVDNTTLDVVWTASVDSVLTHPLASTSNSLYVTMGTPDIDAIVTLKRITLVTLAAKGATNENEIVDGLWSTIFAPRGLISQNAPTPLWKMLDPGFEGQCIEFYNLFQLCLGMLGNGPVGELTYVYPDVAFHAAFEDSGDAASRSRDARSGHSGHTNNNHVPYVNTEVLQYLDGANRFNRWEACLKYDGKYYAFGSESAVPYASPAAVLIPEVQATVWMWAQDAGTDNPCIAPGPSMTW